MHSVRGVPCPLPAILANFFWRRNLRGPSMRWVVGITIGGSSWGRIDVSGPGGQQRQAGRRNVGRLRAARLPLHFRLRSTELVDDLYLRERSIDPDTVLALLPANRLMPLPALLSTRKRRG